MLLNSYYYDNLPYNGNSPVYLIFDRYPQEALAYQPENDPELRSILDPADIADVSFKLWLWKRQYAQNHRQKMPVDFGGAVATVLFIGGAAEGPDCFFAPFGRGGTGGRPGRAPEFVGGQLTEAQFLDAAMQYLGSGYQEVSPGRYVSTDGMRQVRYGTHETGGPVHHAHFEAYDRPYNAGGTVVENTRVIIVP